MRHRRQWIVIVSIIGLLASVVTLGALVPARSRLLSDTGETKAAVTAALERLLPATAESPRDPSLTGALDALKGEPYVAYVWLVDAGGAIAYHSGGPGEVGRNVVELAKWDAARIVDGLPDGTLAEAQRLLVLTMGALRAEGDHNDVFRHKVWPVSDRAGVLRAVVGLTYEVNPSVSGPGGWWSLSILLALAGLGVYWLGLPVWVYLDAQSRGEARGLWASLVLLTNLVGLVAYLIATSRPPSRTA